MDTGILRRLGVLVLIFIGAWLGVRYLLPIALPFALGLVFALLAEPGVRFLSRRLRIPRAVASALAVGSGFVMIFALVWLVGAAAYKELTVLASGLPGFFEQISVTVSRLRDWAMGLAARAPEGLNQSLQLWMGNLFANGSVLLEKAATGALGFVGNLMGGVPDGALLIGTAVLSSFMISAQLPGLKEKCAALISKKRLKKGMATLGRLKTALAGWLKAQVKLSGVTLGITLAGYFLLRVKNPVFWAVITALVDAVPLLGTGTVLIPWCLIALLQGEKIRALGLLGVYVTAALTRSMLEPKLVGRHLGLNPLLTLVALYAGYRFWGVGGMIFAPVLAVMARQLASLKE